MNWGDWVLVYVAIGAILTLLRLWREYEARQTLSVVVCWPIWCAHYPFYKISRWRQEKARQERISAKVASGEYDADHAREYLSWKG